MQDFETQPVDDLFDLIPIEGPPAAEAAVADRLRTALVSLGIPESALCTDRAQDQSEYGGNTGNLIVRFDGHGRGERWMFSTHMDTVPDAVGTRPRVEGDDIVSDVEGKALGGDNRAGCAVLLQVARSLVARDGDHPAVTLVFFIQEEVGLVGARGLDLDLVGSPRPSCAFNFDGGAPDELVTAVIGTERFVIDIEGIAVHAGSRPEQGVSAATLAGIAIGELQREGWVGRIQRPEGEGSANIGTIHGGTGTNVVMPHLNILAEARSHSPEFRRTIIDTWKAAFERAVATTPSSVDTRGAVAFSPGPTYEPFALPDDAPVVRAVEAAAAKCGLETRNVINNGGMDANWIVAHEIPAVTIGVGQSGAHTPQERLNLPRFRTACRLAVAIADSHT
ncbi:MAG: peptidase M20 [Gemmatimonadetes bacterium]|nr:peptidase M20 [Gemmatimonadota bacterium]|tara:strand:+ start:1454 stop:2632 length:1179 start_codon:yes stop_codon:yes gene_type:complete